MFGTVGRSSGTVSSCPVRPLNLRSLPKIVSAKTLKPTRLGNEMEKFTWITEVFSVVH